ncbi:MAG: hypothetical protein V4510_12705 [bacterium]
MSFEFDEDETLGAFAHAGMVDLDNQAVTLYAVVCIGSGDEPHFSHGGELTLSAVEAVRVAKAGNLEPGPHGCRYLPAAMGLDVESLFALASQAMAAIKAGEEEE